MRRSQMVASTAHTVAYDADATGALCCNQLDAIFRTASAYPDAIVAMFPPDYDVSDDIRFMASVREAATFVEQNPSALVALGVASGADRERGTGTWLVPAGDAFLRPERAELICHPDPFQWARLQRVGGLAATGTMVFHSTIMRGLVESRVPSWVGACCAALRDAKTRHVRMGHPPHSNSIGTLLPRVTPRSSHSKCGNSGGLTVRERPVGRPNEACWPACVGGYWPKTG